MVGGYGAGGWILGDPPVKGTVFFSQGYPDSNPQQNPTQTTNLSLQSHNQDKPGSVKNGWYIVERQLLLEIHRFFTSINYEKKGSWILQDPLCQAKVKLLLWSFIRPSTPVSVVVGWFWWVRVYFKGRIRFFLLHRMAFWRDSTEAIKRCRETHRFVAFKDWFLGQMCFWTENDRCEFFLWSICRCRCIIGIFGDPKWIKILFQAKVKYEEYVHIHWIILLTVLP